MAGYEKSIEEFWGTIAVYNIGVLGYYDILLPGIFLGVEVLGNFELKN